MRGARAFVVAEKQPARQGRSLISAKPTMAARPATFRSRRHARLHGLSHAQLVALLLPCLQTLSMSKFGSNTSEVLIQYATKEVARHMATPSERNWLLTKRLGRYLKDHPRLIQEFR